MTVLDMVEAYLREHGHDGLSDGIECGCGVDDLAPCSAINESCLAAHRVESGSLECRRLRQSPEGAAVDPDDCDDCAERGGHCYAPDRRRPNPAPAPRSARVYVAGAYSADTVLGVAENIRRGRAAVQAVEEMGCAPYDPWADFPRRVAHPADLDTCYAVALAWMEAADAVLVSHGEGTSPGTQREIARAEALGIPVFRSLDDLAAWRARWRSAPESVRPARIGGWYRCGCGAEFDRTDAIVPECPRCGALVPKEAP